jgi:hypothetical protein
MAVRIEQVELLGREAPEIAGMRLARPQARTRADQNEIEIRGWVVPEGARAVGLEIHCAGEICAETPIDVPRPNVPAELARRPGGERPGFLTVINALRLPTEFELLLRARLEDGEHLDVATIRGSRSPVAGPEADGLQPVLVVSPTGRTGTTWVVQLLGQHPALVAYPPFGVEPRAASYWLEVASTLVEPGSYRRILRTQMERPGWWRGEWPEASRDRIEDKAVERFLAADQALRSINWARAQTQLFYEAVAAGQGKAEARHFVEKAPYGRLRLELLSDIFPGLRDIVLFRDPRDTMCSILAYSRKQPRVALVSSDPGIDDDYLAEVRDSFLGLLEQTREREQALLVRYEDLMANPASSLRRIFEHVGVEAGDETVAAAIEGAAAAAGRLDQHRTSGEASSSIGRWRRDLEPDLQERMTEVFAPVLDRLGYRRMHADSGDTGSVR